MNPWLKLGMWAAVAMTGGLALAGLCLVGLFIAAVGDGR